MLKRLTILLFAILLLTSCVFIACRTEVDEPPTGIALFSEGTFNFTIVRSDFAPKSVIDFSVNIRKALSDLAGIEAPIVTDWDGDTDNSARPEILVGDTNRSETKSVAETLGENDYCIKLIGCKLVIAGGSENALEVAVGKFLTDYLNYTTEGEVETMAELLLPDDLSVTGTFVPKLPGNFISKENKYTFSQLSLSTTSENADLEYIVTNTGNSNEYLRFTDGGAELIYKFNISEMYEPSVQMTISQNFHIEASEDGKTYTKVFAYTDISDTPVRGRTNEMDYTFSPYDFGIYDTLYLRLTDCDPSDGWGTAITRLIISYYIPAGEDGKMVYLTSDTISDAVRKLSEESEPISINDYSCHSDNGLIYNPISREKAAQLTKYKDAECFTGELDIGGVKVTYSVPKKVTAYDAVPVTYTIKSGSSSRPVHLEATAFEDAERTDGNVYYDLNLPGNVALDIKYLGYVAGYGDASKRPDHSNTGESDRIALRYPNYSVSELRVSSNIERTDYTWFKFSYTNTGDTILDGNGSGTFCFEPLLQKKNPDGTYANTIAIENLYLRIEDELYPGETGELYVPFNTAGIPEGEYRILINCLVRNETQNPENYGKNIWGGEVYYSAYTDVSLTDSDAVKAPNPIITGKKSTTTRNRWLHTYEEFASSFDSWLTISSGDTESSVMYLQCAPWTNQVVLKLILGNTASMTGIALPIEVESNSVKVIFNPDNNNYVELDNGTRFPAIQAQSMADMRANVQLGPDAEYNVVDIFIDMKEAGINIATTTAAFEYDSTHGRGINNNIDAFWFSADVMRIIGIKMEGFVTYPFESSGNTAKASWISGLALESGGVGSPALAQANAIKSIYQFMRWGDNYWIGGNDTVVLSSEDTRGWMRVDFNARITMSELSKNNFRIFLMELYDSIDTLNDAWDTNYESFFDIDPEADVTDDHGWKKYQQKDAVFVEWSKPLADLDSFRTLERIIDYKGVTDRIADGGIPNAKINLRTEGANWIADVDEDTENSHFRHVYYCQRRCGIIPELMATTGTVYAHSDYTTLPYTPSEVAELTQKSIEAGIVPIMLPQFNRMRDIAINSRYGTSYTFEYNLRGRNTKGAYINTVCSVFEWFKATYENGGVPGILWQDYLCDGYATTMQRKEIEFFVAKLTEAMNTEEGRSWATDFESSDEITGKSKALYSYDSDYVEQIVAEYLDAEH